MLEMPSRRITHHPLFRWALAVWFAALAGGGLFAVPAIFHAILLARLGFYKIGVEPRVLIAGTGALVCGLIGLGIGILLAPRQPRVEADDLLPAPADPGEDEPQYRVFDARAELGDIGLAAPAEPEIVALPDPTPAPALPDPAMPAPALPEPAMERVPEALGDLSLGQLTDRLARALAAAQGAPPRREPAESAPDPQDALRSALDMLSRSGAN